VAPSDLAERLCAELAAPGNYAAAGCDIGLTLGRRPRRLEPARYADSTSRGRPTTSCSSPAAPGITRSVLAFASETGVRLALVGSSPSRGPANETSEIQRTWIAFALRITARYFCCDVSNAGPSSTGPPGARNAGNDHQVVHGPGLNPSALEKFRRPTRS
jgi:hypothetical protein